ncbi:hypothetical protein C9374_003342 [Naegleria lovaniensis]|uniref:Uncharacterized protein n=1 Tax=Naegleria lovaniensis TaxID=51637 RepID=A0AA88KPL0_NAELO|nr:uncharacterized protein C9374_003342 [Naegleria lovaniensis]KAG2385527.1 hypothetical protein C9374_003342 [Naegleria lovaniensis]
MIETVHDDENGSCSDHDDHSCCHHHHHEDYEEKDPQIIELFGKVNSIFSKLEKITYRDDEEEQAFYSIMAALFPEECQHLVHDEHNLVTSEDHVEASTPVEVVIEKAIESQTPQDILIELLSDFKYGKDRRFHGKLYMLSKAFLFVAKFWSLQFYYEDSDDEQAEKTERKYIPDAVDESKLAKCVGFSFAWVNVIFPRSIPEYEPYICVLIDSGKLKISDLWLEKGLNIVSFTSSGNGRMNIKKAPLHFSKRMISQFRGENLVIGDKHNETTNTPEMNFTLDIDIAEEPDVVGDAFNEDNLLPFPTHRFSKVIFNFIGHNILLNKPVIMQYFRILRSNGILDFKTEHVDQSAIEPLFARKYEFEKNLWNSGFCDISVQKKYDDETTKYAPYYLHVQARKR